jgi:hypothetical protein
MAKRRRRKLTCSSFIGLTGRDVTAARERMAERDRLAALDNRTPAQRWLNDPPLWRSALQKSDAQQGRPAEIKSAAATVQKGRSSDSGLR